MLHDHNRRIGELEKNVKDVNLRISIEIMDKINKLFALLEKKANLDDLHNIRDELTSKKIVN